MPNAPRVQATTPTGGRKPSPETRAKLSAAALAKQATMTPEQIAARNARLRRGRAPAAADPPAPSTGAGGSPAPSEDWRGPLDDTRAAGPGGPVAGESSAARPVAAAPLHAAPIFSVPDVPAMELGGDGPLGPGGPAELADAPSVIPAVSVEQVRSLVELPFSLIALRRGEHWRLRDDEAQLLAEPMTRKVNESAALSRAVAAGGDWTVIGVSLAVIVTARIQEDNERAEREPGARGVGDSNNAAADGPIPNPDARRAGFGLINGGIVPAGARTTGGDSPVAAEGQGAYLGQTLSF